MQAGYRYDPFGKILTSSGSLKDSNVYRFSSKEHLASTSAYHYGYRLYDPAQQRWLNRDPLEEFAGNNLYTFVSNRPLFFVDPYGLDHYQEPGFTKPFTDADDMIPALLATIPAFSIGVVAQGSGEVGWGTGSASSMSLGGGVFYDGNGSLSIGGYKSGGAFTGSPGDGLLGASGYRSAVDSPCGHVPFVAGYSGGGSSGLFVSNAKDVAELGGPFDQFNFNGPAFSFSAAWSGSTWIVSLTSGGRLSKGFSVSYYPTSTFRAGGITIGGKPIEYKIPE